MNEQISFETLADNQGIDRREYLSTVIAKLPRADEDYRAIQERINAIYERYPKVMGLFDQEDMSALTEEECAAVIEITRLRNHRMEIEPEAAYFRGCYDSVGYSKRH